MVFRAARTDRDPGNAHGADKGVDALHAGALFSGLDLVEPVEQQDDAVFAQPFFEQIARYVVFAPRFENQPLLQRQPGRPRTKMEHDGDRLAGNAARLFDQVLRKLKQRDRLARTRIAQNQQQTP